MFAPAGAWSLEYAENSCNLGRIFANGDDKIVAYFLQYAPYQNDFELRLIGKPIEVRPDAGPIIYDFGGGFGEVEVDKAVSGHRGEEKTPMIFAGNFRLGPKAGKSGNRATPIYHPSLYEPSVDSLRIDLPGKRHFLLQLGRMSAPMQAMRKCTANLFSAWELVEEEQLSRTKSAEPRSNPGSWVDPDDYPESALNNQELGQTKFVLLVETDGKVSECRVQSQVGQAEFGEAACAALKRNASFTPALDKAGKPMRSAYVNTVRWIIR